MERELKSFKELAGVARKTTAYFVQGAILDFTENVVMLMRAKSMSKTQLAKKLNTSPAFVTKVLSGENNFTLETMVKIAMALDSELRISLPPQEKATEWKRKAEHLKNAA